MLEQRKLKYQHETRTSPQWQTPSVSPPCQRLFSKSRQDGRTRVFASARNVHLKTSKGMAVLTRNQDDRNVAVYTLPTHRIDLGFARVCLACLVLLTAFAWSALHAEDAAPPTANLPAAPPELETVTDFGPAEEIPGLSDELDSVQFPSSDILPMEPITPETWAAPAGTPAANVPAASTPAVGSPAATPTTSTPAASTPAVSAPASTPDSAAPTLPAAKSSPAPAQPSAPAAQQAVPNALPKHDDVVPAIPPVSNANANASSSVVRTSADEKLPQPSAARDLVESLVKVPDKTLEGVKRVPLVRYLGVLSVSEGAGLEAALTTYWKTAKDASAVAYWTKRQSALNQLSADAREKNLLEAARSAADMALTQALVSMRTTAVELGQHANQPYEIWAETLPHAGNYKTQYEQYEQEGRGSARVALLNQMVSLRGEQLSSMASAYQSSEAVLQELLKNKASIANILPAMDAVNVCRERLFDVLIAYNQAILKYALSVSSRRGSDLARLLIVVKPNVPTEGYVIPPGGTVPMAPTPADPATQPTPADPQPKNPSKSVTLPPAEPVKTFADDQPGKGKEAPIEAPALLPDNSGPSEMPILPGGMGVPPVETPPPSQEFQPIGGATGSDSTLPPVAPPPTNGARNDGQAPQKSPLRLVSMQLPEPSEKTGTEAANALPAPTLSLNETTHAGANGKRLYWRYVTLQSERKVLEYQRQILDLLSRKVLNSTDFTKEDVLAGLLLEQHTLMLKAESIERKIQSLTTAWELSRTTGISWSKLKSLPTAVTQPQSENFQLRLDGLQPGTEAHKQALLRARHLDYTAKQLAAATSELATVSKWLTAPEGSLEESPVGKQLAQLSPSEYATLFLELQQARRTGSDYLQLVYKANEILCL